MSGKIDVGILTTGLSTAARKKQADLVASIKENLKKKGNTPTISWQKLFMEIKENSQIVSVNVWFEFLYYTSRHPIAAIDFTNFLILNLQLITREQFEDALKIIQDDGVIVVMGKTTIRICKSTD